MRLDLEHVHSRIHVHPHACVIGAGAHARGTFYWGEVWQCEGIEAGGSQMSLVRTSTLMSLPARVPSRTCAISIHS